MSFTRKPFKMSAYAAEKLSHLRTLEAHNLGAGPEVTAPFVVHWPSNELPGGASRFRLPSIVFEKTEVARLGFRGAEGFLLLRDGLSAQVQHAVERRFMRLLDVAKNNHKVLQEESRFLLDRFHDVFGRKPSINRRSIEVKTGWTDSRNILRTAFAGTEIDMKAASISMFDVSLRRSAFKISQPILRIRSIPSNSDQPTTWELASGVRDLNPDPDRVKALATDPNRGMSEDVRDIITTRVREQRPTPRHDAFFRVKSKTSWSGMADDSGFSLHKDGSLCVLKIGHTEVATFMEDQRHFSLLDATAILRRSHVTTKQLESIAHDIIMASAPRRTVRTPDEAWLSRLETTISGSDPGYS